jgi:hypothetical protein
MRFGSQFFQLPIRFVPVFRESAIAQIFNQSDTPLRRLSYAALTVQFLLVIAAILTKTNFLLFCPAAEWFE